MIYFINRIEVIIEHIKYTNYESSLTLILQANRYITLPS